MKKQPERIFRQTIATSTLAADFCQELFCTLMDTAWMYMIEVTSFCILLGIFNNFTAIFHDFSTIFNTVQSVLSISFSNFQPIPSPKSPHLLVKRDLLGAVFRRAQAWSSAWSHGGTWNPSALVVSMGFLHGALSFLKWANDSQSYNISIWKLNLL